MNYESLLLSLGQTAGYVVIFAIIFAESGLFFGFFLPGDSFLFTLGLLAQQGHFSVTLLIVLCCIAAITGDSVGYAFGRRVGPALFKREDSLFFKKSHLERAHKFYERHGVKTIILARFVPFARTFAPILAGIGNMHYPTFLVYNVIGGIGWVLLMTLAGYFLGAAIPNIDRYILPIIGTIVVVSVIPAISEIIKSRKVRHHA